MIQYPLWRTAKDTMLWHLANESPRWLFMISYECWVESMPDNWPIKERGRNIVKCYQLSNS